MAYTTINKHTDYFNTVLYTGTHSSSSQAVTGVGFQPDWVWLKNRTSSGYDQRAYDAVRGVTKLMNINLTNAEGTDASITSTVSVNTTAGFSIVTWNGNSGTVGHGLGVKPDFIVVKSRQTAGSNNWVMTGSGLGANMNDTYLTLNTDSVQGSSSNTWGGEPTAQHFTVSSGVAANDNNVAYCFATKKGYSSSGQYKGSGNANGSFIYTGFKPAFVMIKSTSPAADWTINDNKRDVIPHPNNYRLFPNTNAAESTGSDSMDFLCNGFKLRSTDSGNNASNGWYWYMAFGQSLVGTNNVPCTAR
jgi:hypothetical protein